MDKKIKQEELIIEAKNFFNFYKKAIGESIKEGRSVIIVNFQELEGFSHEISELLSASPEEILQILELSLEELGLVANPRIRLVDCPEGYEIKIRNIRAKHLNRLIVIEGIVRQASDVRPQVINAKFECPSCGTVISILQIEKKFREPSRCSCGRKAGFKLISKDMVDAQRIVIEESPESLTGGEQPRRMSVFLKEDLVDPKMEERTTPGSRVKVIGVLKEVPIPLQTGALSTRFDLAVEANNVIPLEETFEELKIGEEDERQINELAADPNIFQKLSESIAPSIFGYDEIKQSLILQLFSGVKKKKSDGNMTRGDIHILLVGDPGVAKSVGKESKMFYQSKNESGYETIEKIYNKFGRIPKNLRVLTINMEKHEWKWCNVKEILRHAPEKKLIKVITEHGKEVIATLDHSFITMKNGEIISLKGGEINKNNYLPMPINYHREILKYLRTDKFNSYRTNSKSLPDKISLDKYFGFFIGIFLSEGYIMNKDKSSKTVIISNKNKEIIGKVKTFIRKLGLNFTERRESIWISSTSLANMLDSCYSGKKQGKNKGNLSRMKKIPEFAYFSPREFIYGILSGLYSGDGRFINDKKRLKGIELATVSRELAENTSDIMMSVGFDNILKKRKYFYNGRQGEAYYVRVPFSYLRLFLEKIKFYGRKTKEMPRPIYSYNDMIPCGDILYQLTKKLGYCRRDMNRTLSAEMRTVKKRGEIGRIRLKKILKIFESDNNGARKLEEYKLLSKIANSEIVWSKVKEVEKWKKEEDVYDLYIPETNTFVVNGIGVHNSQMLKFMSGIAPKGRYIVGKSASGAGITATVVRDEYLRGWSLEAGAMVLANHGLVCLLPHSNIILDNKIMPIEDAFTEKNKKLVLSNNEKVEVCDISFKVPALLGDSLEFGNVDASMIRRKMYNGRILRINLDSGFSLALTPNHKLVDGNNLVWKEAKEFRNGDFLLAPLKLPEKKEEVFILDILPDNWIVCLSKEEKCELKNTILNKYKNLEEFNLEYEIDKDYLSGGKQLQIRIFKKILNEFGIYESWKKRNLKYGRKKSGESLKTSIISPELAYFIGFTYGDGSIRINDRHSNIQINQSIKNIRQIDNVRKMFLSFSNGKLSEYRRVMKSMIRGKETSSDNLSLTCGSNLIAYLYDFFTKDSLSNLLQMNNECVKAFVAGTMDSDGCISIKNSLKNGKKYQMVDIEFLLSNNSEECKNFILALRRLDCYAKFIPGKEVNKIRITGRSDIVTLIKSIENYSIKIKELPKKKTNISSSSDKLPKDIVSDICNLVIEKCGKKQKLNELGISSIVYDYKNKVRQPSRAQLRKILELGIIPGGLKDRAEILLKRDFFIDKIAEVKEEDYSGYVYDLFIPNKHNFICDGVVVHNCIDELEKMDPEDRSAMHEAMEQQCYLPDLEVNFADGTREKIGIFVDSLIEKNKNRVVKGVNCEILPLDDKEILTTDFESIYPVKIKNVSRHIAPTEFVKIELANGRSIKVTPEHPCWITNDGKIKTVPAIKLKKGEFFPIPGELPIKGEERAFEVMPFKNGPSLCKLLGYHITDGCYELNRGKKNGIQFCNNDKILIDDYFDSVKNTFGKTPALTKRGALYSVRVISREVIEFFNELDKSLLEKGKFKKIPERIMRCRNQDLALLLRALFDGDGTVVNLRRNGCRVNLVCENRELAEQVTELLLRFAITSSIYKDNDVFRVDVTGYENLRKFYDNIGFLSKKKYGRLKLYVERKKAYRSINDVVPNASNSIRRIAKLLNINIEKEFGNQICMNCNKHRPVLKRMISVCEEKLKKIIDAKEITENSNYSGELKKAREMLKLSLLEISKSLGISDYMLDKSEEKNLVSSKYRDILLGKIESMISVVPELRELKKLAFGNIRWSRVKSVELVKNENIKWVYDITVEPTHSFISNNMVLHNSVTISKANIQATLRAETSVLAAANPKLGRFDPYQPIAQQIDIPPTLLNRFDVIFTLRDMPDRGKDEAIASHVLMEHQKQTVRNVIDRNLLRKYVAYAKQNVIPVLTDEAVDEIKRFYVELRNAPSTSDSLMKPIPISARQLEALVRLSESSAKSRLSKKVTKEDALRAINLMKYYLMQVGYDYESKTFDIDKIVTGVPASQRSKIILMREALARLESRLGKLIPLEEIEKEMQGKLNIKEIEEVLDKLTISGDIFHPRKGYVQRT